jgi:hypothetical protein
MYHKCGEIHYKDRKLVRHIIQCCDKEVVSFNKKKGQWSEWTEKSIKRDGLQME